MIKDQSYERYTTNTYRHDQALTNTGVQKAWDWYSNTNKDQRISRRRLYERGSEELLCFV
jgi:hypothetical protein